MTNFIWTFRDAAFQSEMLPSLEDLGFDYASDPQPANDGHDVLWIAIEGATRTFGPKTHSRLAARA